MRSGDVRDVLAELFFDTTPSITITIEDEESGPQEDASDVKRAARRPRLAGAPASRSDRKMPPPEGAPPAPLATPVRPRARGAKLIENQYTLQYDRHESEFLGIQYNSARPPGKTFPPRYLAFLDRVYVYVLARIAEEAAEETTKTAYVGGDNDVVHPVEPADSRAPREEGEGFAEGSPPTSPRVEVVPWSWRKFFCAYGGRYNCCHRFLKSCAKEDVPNATILERFFDKISASKRFRETHPLYRTIEDGSARRAWEDDFGESFLSQQQFLAEGGTLAEDEEPIVGFDELSVDAEVMEGVEKIVGLKTVENGSQKKGGRFRFSVFRKNGEDTSSSSTADGGKAGADDDDESAKSFGSAVEDGTVKIFFLKCLKEIRA